MTQEAHAQPPISTIAVIGAGTMGLAIARLFASTGRSVRVYDARIADLPEFPGIEACSDLPSCLAGADIIFEAISEQLSAKQALLRQIQELVGPVPVASNTSTFRPGQLAEGLVHPEAILVAHFFHPADIVPLVELVPHATTASSALTLTRSLIAEAGKVVVSLNREVDGFIANRLQAALIREAVWLLRQGIASAEEIDAAVVHGIGPRWALAGPFEVMDRGGLNIWQAVTERLFPLLSVEASAPKEILVHVERGELGAKSGQGFYAYDAHSASPMSRLGAVLLAASTPVPSKDPAPTEFRSA
ncbi:3-hydroxyacyl-CoA dehydrogenase family protein [Arthrobacter sp. StoSoilB22]|uniref:3-hydroxyacyl-CoA dehydrogenase family protein n=1 Tax=Arthrobacter sp. StoSoilB22 TaxID=2830996 RepID=UPI001CC41E77|nr:3-hydroxyacyl-CoA dehydrogenase family protein [Arthrobacter sp. StoSoilB22]BCW62911.1 3-hydroxybutyryl-CoA dehydrogenase [Arthrobacter sp. StoSoilB22]